MIEHQDDILEGLQNGHNVDVIYIDFSKAYDKVDIGILIHKIRNMGFENNLGQWIVNFVSNRTQTVTVNSDMSK